MDPSLFHPIFELDYLAPTLHKWYGPRHLPDTYLQPWYQNNTQYARIPYERYLSTRLEGQTYYDSFGNLLGRGWQVYSWVQEQAAPRGSSIDKQRQFTGAAPQGSAAFAAYDNFFKRLIIATDKSDGSAYRLSVGDAIYTRFTPLTFYKPRFNGIRLDWAANGGAASLVLSRPSDPNDHSETHATHLVGARGEAQLGGRATFGLTFVNAHNVLTQIEFNEGNPLHGALTSQQNQPLSRLWVRIRDDSPGQGTVGAALADFDIVLVDTTGRQLRGSEIGFAPAISGGVSQAGRLVALDAESILLEYDLENFEFDDIRSADLRRVEVELAVANDYRVEVASDLQTDGETFNPEIIFLPVHRAAGNTQDNSNAQVLSVDYGLPAATEIIGFDWNLVDWAGFSLQGEWALNRRFWRYPNPALPQHHQSVTRAAAAYAKAAYNRHPWQLFLEAFAIADDYHTDYWLTDGSGRIRYKNPIPQVYEFVDDDDDLNGLPEWQRPFQPWNDQAWPGFDENRDFLNDHNQNRNLQPDYEEPFLRFRSDRPDFLFGPDQNHNGTIDRFENDDLPDYPYKPDHRGYNGYIQASIGPDFRLLLGRQHMELIAGDGRTRSWYGLLAWELKTTGGLLRFFAQTAKVRDTIADDLIQWTQPLGAPGRMRALFDVLPAQNTWRGTLYADWGQRLWAGLWLQHRFKWEWWHQLDGTPTLLERELRPDAGFVGAIDKAEWNLPVGLAVLKARFKSEFRRNRPVSRRQPQGTALEETATLLWTQPILAERSGVAYFPRYGRQLFASEIQFGLEAGKFWLLDGQFDSADTDFSQFSFIAQLTNRTAYQGYKLIARMGLQLNKRRFARRPSQNETLVFLSINAGLR